MRTMTVWLKKWCLSNRITWNGPPLIWEFVICVTACVVLCTLDYASLPHHFCLFCRCFPKTNKVLLKGRTCCRQCAFNSLLKLKGFTYIAWVATQENCVDGIGCRRHYQLRCYFSFGWQAQIARKLFADSPARSVFPSFRSWTKGMQT